MEAVKLDDEVAVPLVSLEPPTAAAAVGVRRPLAHLSQRGAPAWPSLLSYGVADEEETTLYFSPDCRLHRPLRRRVHTS